MKKVIIKLLLILSFLFFLPLTVNVLAATLEFNPATITTSAGQSFDLNIVINAGSDQITSVDAFIVYDANLLEVVSVTDGTFFPTISKDTSVTGKAYIAGMVNDPATYKTGSGTLASIRFTAKANGVANVTFDCAQGLTTDSNITKNDLNATDIIQCASNGSASVVIGTGGATGPTATPRASSAGSTLPRSGIFDNVVKYSIPGAVLLFLGGVAKLIL
ncbi:MAG: cohesin domain-containing protein [Microgenomates group bacterium]|nr:cohesin domain-containing protein [Microgenomates group bacterium]